MAICSSARTSARTSFHTAMPFSIASSRPCAARFLSDRSTSRWFDRRAALPGSETSWTINKAIIRTNSSTMWSWSSTSLTLTICFFHWKKMRQRPISWSTSRIDSSCLSANRMSSLQRWCLWHSRIEMRLESWSWRFCRWRTWHARTLYSSGWPQIHS